MGPKRVVINQEEAKNNNAQRGRKGAEETADGTRGRSLNQSCRKTMDQNSKINRKLAGQPVSYFLFEFHVIHSDSHDKADGGSQAQTIILQCSLSGGFG
jgi:hypothetical protein